jgi:hypothetical protein
VIKIRSYLRQPDSLFAPIEDVTETPSDPRHVEGAIQLSIDEVPILDNELWDDVDQLWAYIGNMVEELVRSGHASTLFPDQPIELTFRRTGNGRVLVSTHVDDDDVRAASVDERELLSALRESGSAFFQKMTTLLPMNAAGYDDAVRRLNAGR